MESLFYQKPGNQERTNSSSTLVRYLYFFTEFVWIYIHVLEISTKPNLGNSFSAIFLDTAETKVCEKAIFSNPMDDVYFTELELVINKKCKFNIIKYYFIKTLNINRFQMDFWLSSYQTLELNLSWSAMNQILCPKLNILESLKDKNKLFVISLIVLFKIIKFQKILNMQK